MVEAINFPNNMNNNLKTNTDDVSKNKNINNYSYLQTIHPAQDQIKLSNPKPAANKLQIASLVVGVFASTAFLIVLLKSLMPMNKNKALLNTIVKANVPDNVRNKLLLEYNKFRKSFMDSDNSQNYINNVLRLNWSKPQNKIIDIDKAKKVLDEDHVGLNKVKSEIISFLKVQNYNTKNGISNNGPLILCLDGPPGVGKTTIAESIAKAMDKPFERVSLAGVSNKSFVKGTERLYKGSEPGQIIKSLQNSGVSDPVILIDEIDKMGSSVEHGDPAFALLDILEPKQCKKFTDEYIELPYDLSNVTFVITSNDLNRIPKVLKDRLSIINIPPYSKQEKMDICNFNVQKIIKKLKLSDSQVEFNPEGIAEIVNQTKDKGARKTIENLKYVFYDVIQHIESNEKNKKIVVNKDFVSEALKNRKENPTEDTSNQSYNELFELLKRILGQ